MTKTAPIKQGVGAREAGRQLGVSHSYLLRLAGQKRLPRHDDGSFDVPACRDWLAKHSDPAQVRRPEGSARWSPDGHSVTIDQASGLRGVSLVAVEAAKHVGSQFEAGIVSAVIALAHQVGAIAGLAAVEEGAPLSVAYGIEEAFPVYFIERAEELLRDLPSFRGIPTDQDLPTRYATEFMDRIDWDVVARERGESADVSAWSASAHEQRKQAA